MERFYNIGGTAVRLSGVIAVGPCSPGLDVRKLLIPGYSFEEVSPRFTVVIAHELSQPYHLTVPFNTDEEAATARDALILALNNGRNAPYKLPIFLGGQNESH